MYIFYLSGSYNIFHFTPNQTHNTQFGWEPNDVKFT